MIPGNQASGGKFIDPPDSISVVPNALGGASDIVVNHTGYKGKSGSVKFRVTSNTGVSSVSEATSGTSRSMSMTGLSNGVSYTFSAVTIESQSSVESLSAVTSSSSLVAGVPTAPAQPTVSAGNGQVTVSWSEPANNGAAITSYIVYWSTSSAAIQSWLNSVNTGSTSTSYTVTGLSNGTAYYFTVIAVNATGQSARSAVSSGATPVVPGPPPPPPCSCDGVARRQYGQFSHLDPAGFGWTCDGTTSYEYYIYGTCGGGACPGEGGYNGALRNGVCGYVAPAPPPPSPPPPSPPPPPPPPPPACEFCCSGCYNDPKLGPICC